MVLKIDYVEFDTADMAGSKSFFSEAFDWRYDDYGPQYQAFANAGLDGGLNGLGERAPGAPLVILKADDLEDALARVETAGGVITRAIEAFPGGRRFHFREPGGNELGVWSPNPEKG